SQGSAILYNFDDKSKIINSISWNFLVDREIFATGSEIDVIFSNIRGGWEGEGNIDEKPLFVEGPLGDYYLCHQAAGNAFDSPCQDMGKLPAAETCFMTGLGMYCMSAATTRLDEVVDIGTVDMGYHYPLPLPSPGLILSLDDHQLEYGDPFLLHFDLHNPSYDSITTDIWILLDIFGVYWCYPTWIPMSEGVNWKTMEIDFLRTYHETVLDFNWPHVNGNISGLRFWGVALKSGTSDLIGDLQVVEWGYF
ncbi:hypothetical protein K8T06_11675, partial [bacterium]|nr:hypothetical protein [bacterium]